MSRVALALLVLLAGCSSGGGTAKSPRPNRNPEAGKIDKGPSIADDRLVRTSDLSPSELATFQNAWRHFVAHSAVWPLYRDQWLARGGAAPYVLSENLFRYFWSASLVGKTQEIDRVAENAAIVGEPAVAYFAKTLVTDKWPLSEPVTAEVVDPDNLNKRIKKTFYHFEMDDGTRRFAARILAAIGAPAVPTLASPEVLKGSRPTSRRYAAFALGKIGTDEAVAALIDMLRTGTDWQDRAAAATALVEQVETNPSAKDALYQAAERDPDEFVRRKANRALAGADRISFY
jgi:hypothetical protein